MLGYENGLGLQTKEKRRANGLLGYEKGLGLLTYEDRLAHYEKTLGALTDKERRAKGLALTKYYCPPPTITMDGMHVI